MSVTELWYKPIPELSEERLANFAKHCETLPNGCIVWTASRHKSGYGKVGYKDDGIKSTFLAHRVAYTIRYGAIPDGMTLDHICKNPSCVNPEHLKPMKLSENVKAGGNTLKTHCPRGHEYTPKNTRIEKQSSGKGFGRICRACAADSARLSRAKRKAAREA